MEFRLFYRGELKSNGNVKHKHSIRQVFHSQLKELWDQQPLMGLKDKLLDQQNEFTSIRKIDGYTFAPLVQEKINLIADLHITLLRPEEPGSIVTQSGDIDNRLKTLFDALRIPQKEAEIPKDIDTNDLESPFFCLLEDDNLISGLTVTTDRLLEKVQNASEVIILLHVHTKITRASMLNLALGI